MKSPPIGPGGPVYAAVVAAVVAAMLELRSKFTSAAVASKAAPIFVILSATLFEIPVQFKVSDAFIAVFARPILADAAVQI